LIKGKIGTFKGSDLNALRQIRIFHLLGYEPTFVVLFRNGKQISPVNYTFDTDQTTNRINLTLSILYEETDTFKYRIL